MNNKKILPKIGGLYKLSKVDCEEVLSGTTLKNYFFILSHETSDSGTLWIKALCSDNETHFFFSHRTFELITT